MVVFGEFRIDVDEERLWKGTTELAIRRKPLSILKYLVQRPGHLVTYAELLEHVWQGTVVSESTVRTQLHELRQLLGEGVIETVIGRGYRFIAAVGDTASAAPAPPGDARIVVGRARELAVLRACVERAHAGQRQLCFVTGEPGIGKTTLVDALLDGLPADAIAARGHCVEQHGTPEPYLAIIELLGRLRQSEHGKRALEALGRHAPTFLATVPSLAPPEQVLAPRAREEPINRELIDAFEALAAQHTLVLVLEDLQWSDLATLDLLVLLAARRERARLVVIATSRRVEAQTVTHPLNPVLRNLVSRGRATAVPLERVAPDDIRDLLARRFPGHAFPDELIETLDRITAGTPLFLVSVLDDLVAREMIAQRDGGWTLTASIDDVRAHRPHTVKQLLDIRLDRLEVAEQRVLEAAAVIGAEFSCGLVAAALELTPEQVDDVCDALVRRSLFLRRVDAGEPWPDGTCHTHYGVTHGLVQEVCLARSAPARRQRWHRLVAEQLERAYGARADEVAHALAMHHERGQSIPQAIHHYVVAGERTAARFASPDALALFRRAHELLARMPASTERDRHELRILAGIVASTLRTSAPSNREPMTMLERMIVLARSTDDAPRSCSALLNLAFRYQLIAEHRAGAELGTQIDALVTSASLHPSFARFASAMTALNRLWRGNLAGVAESFEAILAGDTLEDPMLGILGPTDRRTVVTCYLATARAVEGDRERALAAADLGLAHAQRTNDPFGLGLAHCTLAWVRLVTGEPAARVGEAARPVLEIPGTELWRPAADVFLACAAPIDAATADHMLREFRAAIPGIPFGTTRLGLALVHALRVAGQGERAGELARELLAFADAHDERVAEPLLTALATG